MLYKLSSDEQVHGRENWAGCKARRSSEDEGAQEELEVLTSSANDFTVGAIQHRIAITIARAPYDAGRHGAAVGHAMPSHSAAPPALTRPMRAGWQKAKA